MYNTQRLKTPFVLKWVLVNFTENYLRSSKAVIFPTGSCSIIQNPRFYSRKAVSNSNYDQEVDRVSSDGVRKIGALRCSPRLVREAQDALLEYLRDTRSLDATDAENISRNSPRFLAKLLKCVGEKDSVRESVAHFLRYNPVYEFEPFFESMSLKPCEYSSLLPHDMMFLSDDKMLLQNYHVFRDYGFVPNKIGEIFKEVDSVFRYEDGVLLSRLQSLQDVFLDRSTVIKLVGLCPSIMAGDEIQVFLKFVQQLKIIEIGNGWIVGHLSRVEESYDWNRMLDLLCLFRRLGCSKEDLGRLLCKHPTLVFRNSGRATTSVIGFLLKFGASKNDILSLFMHFPEIEVWECVSNLKRSYRFLSQIGMRVHDIGRIFRERPFLLGSCCLKSVKCTLNFLNMDKNQLCEIVKKNPHELMNLVCGLPAASEECTLERTKFLLDLGFIENSSELKKALKRCHARGRELQERFEFLVNAGFNRNELVLMLRACPQIINQTKEVLEMKIDFLVNGFGYSLSSLAVYSHCLSYSMKMVKLRLTMYNWLQEQGAMKNSYALSTILCSDKKFVRTFVNRHPRGIEVWEKLKKQIYSGPVT